MKTRNLSILFILPSRPPFSWRSRTMSFHRAPPSLRSGSFLRRRFSCSYLHLCQKRVYILSLSPYPNAAVSRELGPWRPSVGVANYILLSHSTIHFLCLVFNVFWQYCFGCIISSSSIRVPMEHALYSSLQAAGLGDKLFWSWVVLDLSIMFSQRSPSSSRWDNSFWKELNSCNR